MKVLNISAINTSLSTGPRFSVPNFVEAQNKITGIRADLLNITPKLCDLDEMSFYDFEYIDYTEIHHNFFKNYDIIIFHSFWHIEFYKIMRILVKLNIPYIIVPRGSFSLEALKRKKIKKKIALKIFFEKIIKESVAIQYLTENERLESFVKLESKDNFILPNGINAKKDYLIIPKNRDVIYMGRLDVITKGLDVLILAINLGKDYFRNNLIKFKFYGSDFPKGGKNELLSQIKKLGIEDIVEINEPIYGIEKEKVMSESEYFIAPSRHEGLPMAILEALSYGMKVFITKETNLLDKVIKYNCGWEITHDPLKIKEVLLEKLNTTQQTKNSNALELIKKEFLWDKIAEKACKIYKGYL